SFYQDADRIADMDGGLQPALQIYRQGLTLEVAEVRRAKSRILLSRDSEFASRQKLNQDHLYEYPRTLAGVAKPPLPVPEQERLVDEAISVIQWRSTEPADALTRSAIRGALEPVASAEANRLDRALLEWRRLQREQIKPLNMSGGITAAEMSLR